MRTFVLKKVELTVAEFWLQTIPPPHKQRDRLKFKVRFMGPYLVVTISSGSLHCRY